jgi:cytochrome b involved in lipid metabolism
MLTESQVYDVTTFAARHPGGQDFLMAAVGRDATAMFESFHDPKAIKILAYVSLAFSKTLRHKSAAANA